MSLGLTVVCRLWSPTVIIQIEQKCGPVSEILPGPKFSDSLKHCHQIFGHFLHNQFAADYILYILLTTVCTAVFRSVSVLTQHANLYGILLRPFKCDCSTPLWQREREREKERLRLILQHPKIHTAIREHR